MCENLPPVCDANGAYAAECSGSTTSLLLDGTGSSDPDGDPLSFSWSSNCPGNVFDDNTSATPTLTTDSVSPCPLNCGVFLTVSDGQLSDECEAAVTVDDTQPPIISLVDGPEVLECNVDPYNEPGAQGDDVCEGSVAVAIGGDVVDPSTVGTYNVTYDAADVCSNPADQAVRTVTVVDTIPPDVAADLIPVAPGDDDEDSDSDSDNGLPEGALLVAFGAADVCDGNPICTAVLEIDCHGDDDDDDSDDDGGVIEPIPVVNGQVIGFDSDDDCEVDNTGGFLEIEASSITLVVTCTDASGNEAVNMAMPPLPAGDDDD